MADLYEDFMFRYLRTHIDFVHLVYAVMEYFPIRRPSFNEENDCTQNLCLFKSIYLANKFFSFDSAEKKDRNNYPEPLSFGSTVHNLVH